MGPAHLETPLSQVILEETTTLGVRVHQLQHRHEVKREMREVETRFGKVRVKVKFVGGKALGATPEYDDCRKLAEEKKVPLQRVINEAVRKYESGSN